MLVGVAMYAAWLSPVGIEGESTPPHTHTSDPPVVVHAQDFDFISPSYHLAPDNRLKGEAGESPVMVSSPRQLIQAPGDSAER